MINFITNSIHMCDWAFPHVYVDYSRLQELFRATPSYVR